MFFAVKDYVGAYHQASPMLNRKIRVRTVVSTLNDTLHVKPLFRLQKARGDPLSLREARGCFFNAKTYLLAFVSRGSSRGLKVLAFLDIAFG
jgi:hypothetical protein